SWPRDWSSDVCSSDLRTLARLRFHPDLPPVPFHDLFANRQPYARAWILGPGVQPLKNPEDALGIARIDPDAVVPYREYPLLPLRSEERRVGKGSGRRR